MTSTNELLVNRIHRIISTSELLSSQYINVIPLPPTTQQDYPSAPPNVVFGKVWPEIKELSKISLEAAAERLSNTDVRHSFELFGYDYMVDEKFTPVLIEVNSSCRVILA